MAEPKWVNRWNCWIAPKPTKPGVWRRKEGGFLVRARVLDPLTKKLREVKITLPVADAHTAYLTLQDELNRIRKGEGRPTTNAQASSPLATTATAEPTLPLWSDYAVSLLERKVTDGTIRSAKTREVWASVLKTKLIPAFGKLRVDELNRRTYLAWRAEIAKLVQAGEYSPAYINGWQSIFAVVTNTAFDEFEIDRPSPTRKLEKFDTRECATYTEEEPNALTPEEVGPFLAKMRKLFPQHFAMTALGFATGLRPSSLRPLRRSGSTPDVILSSGVLFVRRSQTRGPEVMKTTKTARHQRVSLPEDLITILQWHIDTLPEGPMADSELLFPSVKGGHRAPSVLDKPFRVVAKAIGLRKQITARGMRRTFQDLARAAEVKDIVTRSISGHTTEEMQQHYSTVNPDEMRSGLARVISLGGFREAHAAGSTLPTPQKKGGTGGAHGGAHRPEIEKGRAASRG